MLTLRRPQPRRPTNPRRRFTPTVVPVYYPKKMQLIVADFGAKTTATPWMPVTTRGKPIVFKNHANELLDYEETNNLIKWANHFSMTLS